jgi:hypothetical protein
LFSVLRKNFAKLFRNNIVAFSNGFKRPVVEPLAAHRSIIAVLGLEEIDLTSIRGVDDCTGFHCKATVQCFSFSAVFLAKIHDPISLPTRKAIFKAFEKIAASIANTVCTDEPGWLYNLFLWIRSTYTSNH